MKKMLKRSAAVCAALVLFAAMAAQTGCTTSPCTTCCATDSAHPRTERIRAKLLSNDRNYVFVAMHRGDWRNFPENSKDAILSCIALGADIVELDA